MINLRRAWQMNWSVNRDFRITLAYVAPQLVRINQNSADYQRYMIILK